MANEKIVEENWLPTQGGTGSAWEPEFRVGAGEWRRVPAEPVYYGDPRGRDAVPGPLSQGGVIAQIGLMGYEQAMAIAWSYAARAAALGQHIEVRAAEYELRYDIKARRRPEPSAPEDQVHG